MRRAYHADSALAAEAELCALAAELDRTHPGAAASLREGMAETLTVLRLGIPPTLARTFRSTNAVESMISICRTHASNVKNWRDGQMALRWCAAGMVEAVFGLLGVVAVASALLVVTTHQLVHAALWLVVTLGSVAGCYLLLSR